MKTRIVLRSYAVAAFEVRPVVWNWSRPTDSVANATKTSIDWRTDATRESQPVHKLPRAPMNFRWPARLVFLCRAWSPFGSNKTRGL
jgi:hypothetical protein